MNLSDGHEHQHKMEDDGYLIDHTSSRFLIDAKGRLIRRYLFSPDPSRRLPLCSSICAVCWRMIN